MDATFRFYEELNDYLEPDYCKRPVAVSLMQNATVGELIAQFGVPLREVDLVLVNSRPVDFSFRLSDGDRVSVYPEFESLELADMSPLPERPLRRPKFILEGHLQKLAVYMRLLGLDTLCSENLSIEEIRFIAFTQKRSIVTSDAGLLQHPSVYRGFCLTSGSPEEQILEVVHRFDLRNRLRALSRCPHCNTPLVAGLARRICTSCGFDCLNHSPCLSLLDYLQSVFGFDTPS